VSENPAHRPPEWRPRRGHVETPRCPGQGQWPREL